MTGLLDMLLEENPEYSICTIKNGETDEIVVVSLDLNKVKKEAEHYIDEGCNSVTIKYHEKGNVIKQWNLTPTGRWQEFE